MWILSIAAPASPPAPNDAPFVPDPFATFWVCDRMIDNSITASAGPAADRVFAHRAGSPPTTRPPG